VSFVVEEMSIDTPSSEITGVDGSVVCSFALPPRVRATIYAPHGLGPSPGQQMSFEGVQVLIRSVNTTFALGGMARYELEGEQVAPGELSPSLCPVFGDEPEPAPPPTLSQPVTPASEPAPVRNQPRRVLL
jgi:hypothetical protein